MSSISLPLKMMLAASALAGLTLIACGEDAPATDTEKEPVKGTKDAGNKKDAGKDAGKKDAGSATPALPQGVPGEECESTLPAQCDDCGETYCATKCEDGVWGDCLPAASLVRDGGFTIPNVIPDGGSITVKDGSVSVMIGDSSLDLPQEECPDPTVCSTMATGLAAPLIMQAAMGAPFCAADDEIGLPPACMTPADCKAMGFGASATCLPAGPLGSFCLQVCKDK